MAIVKQITTTLYLVIFACFGQTLGNTVSLPSASGYVGESLELTCTFTPTTSPSLLTINWFLNNNPDSIQRDASTCGSVVAPPSYDIARYAFICSGNTFKLKILSLQISDNNGNWSCSVSFSSADPVTAKAYASINVTYKTTAGKDWLLLLLLLLLLKLPLVFAILICCGCLDCCKCCRIFDHYNGKKCCYVTCYCLKKGCCSFFFCRSGSKRGKLFGGHKSKKEHCGGCHSCQKKCGCGWPNFCQLNTSISCSGCYCICCVEGKGDQDEPFNVGTDMQASPARNGPPALYTETKNKVHPLDTKLPPVRGVTLGETVELKEPRKKKKKKNKDKLDLE